MKKIVFQQGYCGGCEPYQLDNISKNMFLGSCALAILCPLLSLLPRLLQPDLVALVVLDLAVKVLTHLKPAHLSK